MLVGIFPVYSILNCNLVCIRNGAHVNKAWWGSTPFPCPCLKWFYCCKSMKVLEVHTFHECCGSTGPLLTAHIAMRGIFSPAGKMLQLSRALHVMLIHKLSCQGLPKPCVCEHLCMNKLNLGLPPGDKSLSHVSLEGSKQQNNSAFLSSSWKSSCTMFVFFTAALNESWRTETLWYLTPGWVLFLSCCET